MPSRICMPYYRAQNCLHRIETICCKILRMSYMEAPLPHPIQISSPSGFGFSEMESETSSRDSDSSHESRLESVRRRRKFVPVREDDPDAEPLLQLRVSTRIQEISRYLYIQRSAKRRVQGLVNCVPAVAYHFCMVLPKEFTQPGVHLLSIN